MDDFKPELLKALLEWVNHSDNDIPRRVTSWDQLEDGQILWQLLHDIDPEYFQDTLPENDNRRTSENWIPRWQNLKFIERTVSTYIREECGQLPALSKRMIPGLKAGAQDNAMMVTAKLTMAVLLAGCFSDKANQRIIKVMGQLPNKGGEAIANAIGSIQALDERMAHLGVDQELTPEPHASAYRTPSRAPSMERDSGLEQEAQLFEANRERTQLRERVAKLSADLEQSRNRVSELEEDLVEARLHLDVRGPHKSQDDDYEAVRAEVNSSRQMIAELETELSRARDVVSSQERQIERLRSDEASKQDLRDELQLIKAERDELSQKTKANENLRKKIQSMSQDSKHLEQLRQDYQTVRERLQELEAVEERCAALEKANKENAQTIVQCETSIFEEKGKRTRVEHEKQLLVQQLEQTRELQVRAEDARKELEDRLRDTESSHHGPRGQSLEDELGNDESNGALDEPGSTKATADGKVSSEQMLLQQRVDILNARLKSLETQYLEQLSENLGLKSDAKEEKDDESERPFLEQNEKLSATETELQELQRKFREQELENAELRNSLNKAPNGISEEAQAQGQQAENERLLAQYQRLLKHSQSLELSLDEKTDLLRSALLDREGLSGTLKETLSAELLAEIKEKIESVTKAAIDDQPKELDDAATEISTRIQASQEALDSAQKELEDQQELITSLRKQLDQAKKEGKELASDELQQEVQNLRRENRLMTTAWYDMTSRLQSNTVILQRRAEAPKSWLGRQRVVVGGGGASSRR